MAGFESADGEDGIFGGGLDGEHEVHGGGDEGRAAENAVTIGVMQDEDGGAAIFSHAAKMKESRLDGRQAVLVAADDADQGVDDDEARFDGEGAIGELFGIFRIAQVITAQRDVVERRAPGGLMSEEG